MLTCSKNFHILLLTDSTTTQLALTLCHCVQKGDAKRANKKKKPREREREREREKEREKQTSKKNKMKKESKREMSKINK